MTNCLNTEVFITGVGVTSPIGQGKATFSSALLEGKHAFSYMQRPGRVSETSFIGAEIQDLSIPSDIDRQVTKTVSFGGKVALATLHEAWRDANLDEVDPMRIGLIIGGSNVNQREQLLNSARYSGKAAFVRPSYGFLFMDTDLCGLCTETFDIQNFAYTIGGASASGNLSIIQAVQAVQAGTVDVCIALGALMDLSYLECQALRSLGAMGSDRFSSDPSLACRPFDKLSDGFIYGENCAAVVVERADIASSRKKSSYAAVSGCSVKMDRNRNPNPSYEGEVSVIKNALLKAGISPGEVDYVNPHGTGSVVGDETELKAIEDCGLSHCYINATKSITGHGLSAAGAMEVVATLLQMKAGKLHPTRNLSEPVNPSFNWVKEQLPHKIKNALSLSMGFGGINTAILLKSL